MTIHRRHRARFNTLAFRRFVIAQSIRLVIPGLPGIVTARMQIRAVLSVSLDVKRQVLGPGRNMPGGPQCLIGPSFAGGHQSFTRRQIGARLGVLG